MAETIEAYLDAFDGRDEVTFIVCTTEEDHVGQLRIANRGWTIDPQEGRSWFELERILAGRPNPPRVELRTTPMSLAEIDALHRTSHCFVSLTRGEGWGLGAFDAAARGNPVVTTGWGGTLEFLSADYPYLVEFDLISSQDDESDDWSPGSDGRWAKARKAHAATLLRSIYEDRATAWTVARRLAPHIRARFDAASATSHLLDALGRIAIPAADPDDEIPTRA
jgi:hypothetical protein